MTYFEPGEISNPRVSPHALIGAASPLWAYFGAATLGGVAYWWMTRWTQAANLEAFFHVAERTTQPVLEAAVEQVEHAVERTTTAMAPPPVEAPPVGGESAPFGQAAVEPATAAVEQTLDAATAATESTIEGASGAYEAGTEAASDIAKSNIDAAEEASRGPSRSRKGSLPPLPPSSH